MVKEARFLKIVVLSRCEQRQTRLLQVLEGYLLTGGMNNYYVKSFGGEKIFWRDALQSRPEVVIQIMEPDEQSRKCAQRIRLYYPDIALVLVGAAAELAVFSYEIGAAYYVPEPVRFDQVDKIAAACVRFLGHKPREIALCSNYGHIAVPWESIRYVRARGRIAQFFTTAEARPVEVYQSLTAVEQQLEDARFLRPFRNTIINMDHVARVTEKTFVMDDGQAVPMRSHEQTVLLHTYRAYCLSRGPSLTDTLDDLRKYRERLSIALKAADICVFEVELQRQAYTFFANAEAVFGVSGEKILTDVAAFSHLSPAKYQQAVTEYFSHPGDAAVIAAAFRDILAGRPTAYNARMKAGDTKFVWCHIDVCPILQEGIPVRMIGVINNLSALQEKHAALIEE